MKTKITRIGAALLAVGACFWSTQAFAQTSTTTVTTGRGAFTEYVPSSETMVVRSEAATSPLRYTVTKQTTIVDESGAAIPIERISPGSQLAIDYTGSGDHLVASRIVVHRSGPAVAPATTTTTGPAAVTTTTGAAVTNAPVVQQEQTNTTTTTTRPLTHAEKHAIHEEKEARRKAEKKEIHREKEALEKAEDKVDDDDDD